MMTITGGALSPDDLESLEETVAIVSDEDAVRHKRASSKQAPR